MDYYFNAELAKDSCVQWIRDFFKNNGEDCNAIVGISGGKDSSVVAALCIEALGRDRVYGVLMPNGIQSDIFDSFELSKFLGLKRIEAPIGIAYDEIIGSISNVYDPNTGKTFPIIISEQTRINLPARLRMAMLYAISQSMNGRVANTCNYSEDYIGYSTRYGDSVGDFSPLSMFTSEEVIEIGRKCGLPDRFIQKPPADGLCGKTDEENLGFSYKVLNHYLRRGECEDQEIRKRIDDLHEKNMFKLKLMPHFDPPTKVFFDVL